MKKRGLKLLLIIIVTLSLIITLVGCKNDDTNKGAITIEINNVDDLIAINQKLGRDYDKATFELKSDIDLGGRIWSPIGASYDNSFNSVFKGNGHTISNITIGGASDTSGAEDLEKVYSPTATDSVGLFGYVTNASIVDLNITFKYQFSSKYAVTHAGGLVGYAFGTNTFKNITINGKLDTISQFKESYEANGNPTYENSGYCYVGGLVGYANGATTIENVSGSVVFNNPENRLERSGTNNIDGNAKQFTSYSRYNTMQIGGVCGYIRNIDISETSKEVRNTIKSANVTSKISVFADRAYLGMVVGSAYNTDISDVVVGAESSLSIDSQYRTEVGGIAGLLDNCVLTNAKSELKDIYVAKAIAGKTEDLARISFVAGGAVAFSTNNTVVTKVDVATNIKVDGRCMKYAGGLIGIMNNSRLSDSTAKGDFANNRFGKYVSLLDDETKFQSAYKVGGAIGKMYGKSAMSVSDNSSDLSDVDTMFTAYQGLVFEVVSRLEVQKTTGTDGEEVLTNIYHAPIITQDSSTYLQSQSVAYILNKAYIDSGMDSNLQPAIAFNGIGASEETSAKYDGRIASR